MNASANQLLPAADPAPALHPLRHWPATAIEILDGVPHGAQEGSPSVVRVLLASLRGSAPREAGACMLVTHAGVFGSIGGGRLEYEAVDAARRLLPVDATPARLSRHVLGIELGQCCGGVVELLAERYTRADRPMLAQLAAGSGTLVAQLADGRIERRLRPAGERPDCAGAVSDAGARVRLLRTGPGSGAGVTLLERMVDDRAPLWLFGAGHVGQALVRVLAGLPLRITWIDSRAGLVPTDLADGVQVLAPAAPVSSLENAPPGARYLVMTHDHALDYALCRAILARGDAAFVGLIGSHSKGARFRSRLAREGLAPERIARLVCPIGVDGIASKWPAAIAVAVAAQLLQSLSADVARAPVAAPIAPPTCTGDCAACLPIP